ncbi:hypothetical protein NDU88_010040 [Pleurodeles waltl]|uniref:Uncharacterized protein n=1 Tax=Pleurodeles waltl TaxID=8319 RepID=A0AAV7RWY5_PLEWA|nr:hypothetical protein NDU88_010040 [Pleurodeles waltl]
MGQPLVDGDPPEVGQVSAAPSATSRPLALISTSRPPSLGPCCTRALGTSASLLVFCVGQSAHRQHWSLSPPSATLSAGLGVHDHSGWDGVGDYEREPHQEIYSAIGARPRPLRWELNMMLSLPTGSKPSKNRKTRAWFE